jgi:SM-20-related protein
MTSSPVSRDTVLAVNPSLVAWPGDQIEYLLLDKSDLIRRTLRLPIATSAVLSQFAQPKAVSRVFDVVTKEVLSDLQSCIDELLLVPARELTRVRNKSVDRWKAFRVSQFGRRTTRNQLRRRRRVHKIAKHEVVVLDGVFDPQTILSVHRWFVQLALRRIDVDYEKEAFGQHWVLQMKPCTDFVKAIPFLDSLSRIAALALPQYRLRLKEAKAYSSTFGDVHLAHEDSSNPTVTLLLFGNAAWRDEWMSEMLFYERGEPTVAVQPRPGRIVIFRGDIAHRAGTPSRLCHESRYSLVLRFDILGR